MNTNDPNKNAKGLSNSKEKKTNPQDPPLSSPNEPTRAFPSEPSSTYSSDPSQYSSGTEKSPSKEPSKIYTKEPIDTSGIGSDKMKTSSNPSKKEGFADQTRKGESNADKAAGDQCCNISSYVASNQEKLATYILLILGLLILLFVSNLFGGLIIGMVAGYYFASEIICYLRNLSQIVENPNQLRYIVLAGVLLGFFIAAPGIFIGAVVVAAFKQVLAGPRA